MSKLFSSLFLLLFLTCAISTRAQQPVAQIMPAASSSSHAIAASPNQGIASLSNLPDADTLIYINPQRILNEVVPKFLPPKDVEGMRKGFEEVRKNAGIDPTKIDYIVMAIRFRKPTGDLHFQPPEVLAVASGDFSADSLIVLARMASQGRLRDEKYGNRTMGLMTIDPMVKEAEKNPLLKGFTEVGIATLNANTIAVGNPNYLRAAIDASDGNGRIDAQTLNSLLRDSNALVSAAGRPWHSFAKSFGMLGTETTERASSCNSKIGDFYAALTMDATNFMFRAALNEDNPDTAKIVSNLISGLLGYAMSELKDPAAQTMLKNLAITAEGDEVMVRADFPQQMVMELIKQHMAPKKQDAAVAPKDVTKPKPTRRRTRRRG